MVKKIVINILIISLVVCFFGLNFDTKVDIRFWFSDSMTLKNISLFAALAGVYLLGLATIIPFYIVNIISIKKLKKTIKKSLKISESDEESEK